jgi:hypothetical protein
MQASSVSKFKEAEVFIRQNSRRVLRWRFQYMARTWLKLTARFGSLRDCWLGDSGRMFGTWVKYIALWGPIWAAGRTIMAKSSLLASGKWNSLHHIIFISDVFRILRANNSVRGEDWNASLEFKFLLFYAFAWSYFSSEWNCCSSRSCVVLAIHIITGAGVALSA